MQRAFAKTHEAAEGGWGCVNNIHAKLLYDIPKTAGIGPCRNTFKHERSTACAQWSIKNIGMTGYPADICRTKMDLPEIILKHIEEGIIGPDHIARAGMYHTLGFTGAATCIKNEQYVFRIHFLGFHKRIALCFHFLYFIFPPHIASLDHTHRGAGMGTNNDFTDSRAPHHGIINYRFQWDGFITPVSAIAGYNNRSRCILNTVGNTLCTETAKNNGMHSAYTCAGKHGNGKFGYHAHVNAHTVALFYPVVFQHIGKLHHLVQQFLIGKNPMRILRIIRLPDNGRFIAILCNMPVEAILGNIQLTALKPFNVRVGKIPVEHFIPFFAPNKMLSHACPKFFGMRKAVGIGHIVLVERPYLIGNGHIAISLKKITLVIYAAKVVRAIKSFIFFCLTIFTPQI